MRKGVIAGFAFGAGFCSWFISKIPPERIVRVKPSDKWTDINGYIEDEYMMIVSKNTGIIPRYLMHNPIEGIMKMQMVDQEICVKSLTFYEKHGSTFTQMSQHTDLTLRAAEELVQKAHQERMRKTTAFHQMVMN